MRLSAGAISVNYASLIFQNILNPEFYANNLPVTLFIKPYKLRIRHESDICFLRMLEAKSPTITVFVLLVDYRETSGRRPLSFLIEASGVWTKLHIDHIIVFSRDIETS